MKPLRTPAAIVYWKEVRESVRDRRVLLNALILGPLMGPVIFFMILHLAVAPRSRTGREAFAGCSDRCRTRTQFDGCVETGRN